MPRSFLVFHASVLIGCAVSVPTVAGAPESRTEQSALRAALLPHYRIYRPNSEGPFATVLFVAGCSGFEHPRAPMHYHAVAERFRAAGRAVVFADYVKARGLAEACRGVLSPTEVGSYVVAAVAHLRTQSFVGSRLDIVGWSLGGGGVLAALASYPEMGRNVRAAVALYPDCSGLKGWQAPVPTLVIFAGKDLVQPPARCHLITQAVTPGARVQLRTFPEAHHGFDMQGLPSVPLPGLPALAYDAAAASAAWVEIARFLELPSF